MTSDEVVFKALADPARRFLLDELFRRDGQTLGALEARLEMTRFCAEELGRRSVAGSDAPA